MKKVLFLLIIIAGINLQSLAQKQGQSKVDSLLSVLKTAKPDTAKVNILNALADEFRNNDPDSAMYFAGEALALAVKLNDKMKIADVHLTLGAVLTDFGNFEKAMKSCNDALAIYEQLLPTAAGNEKTGDKSRILKQKAAVYNNMGNIYMEQGNYPEAMKNYFTSLKIKELTGDKKGIAASYNNLGNISTVQGNYPEALKDYLASLQIFEEIGDQQGIASSYNNIGAIYYNQRDYTEASKNYLASLKIKEQIGDKKGIAASYNNLGFIYMEQGKYPDALKLNFAAMKICEEIEDKQGLAFSCNNIGFIYMKQKKNKEAYQYLNNGLSLAKEIGSLYDITTSFSGLAALDSATGNYKQALEHFKLYVITRDSMFNQENIKKMVQSKMQYEFDKKEALAKVEQENKDALAQKEIQKQKLVRNGFIGGFAVVLFFAYVVFRQRNKISKEKKISEEERKKSEAEKERSEELLLNILPATVAAELKQTGHCLAKTFSMVTVMFADFKDFTIISEKVSAELLVDEINYCFSAFDAIVQKYKVEKIKTVGDAYVCVGGLPVPSYSHAFDMVSTAIEIRNFMLKRKQEKEAKGEITFELRVGIHTGPVVAGIVGVKKFQYDIWGDTVNLAARLESSGEVGQVNISGTTYSLVKDKFNCTHRGKITAKNKGELDMYFVEMMND
jgi:adenylate cyclase